LENNCKLFAVRNDYFEDAVLQCVVRSYAQDAGLKLHEWPLRASPGTYDVGVVVSFGHLIPKRIIDLFP